MAIVGGSLAVKKFRNTLELQKRQRLQEILSKGKADVRRLEHAQILLVADERGGAGEQIDTAIAKPLHVGGPPSSGSAAGSWRRGWRGRYTRTRRDNGDTGPSSTGRRKPD